MKETKEQQGKEKESRLGQNKTAVKEAASREQQCTSRQRSRTGGWVVGTASSGPQVAVEEAREEGWLAGWLGPMLHSHTLTFTHTDTLAHIHRDTHTQARVVASSSLHHLTVAVFFVNLYRF